MKRTTIALTCALALAAAAPLVAGEAGHDCPHEHGKHGHGFQRPSFEEMDADKDGKLSFEEFRSTRDARLREWYDKMDGNGDGSVTKEELAAVKAKHRPEKKTETETD